MKRKFILVMTILACMSSMPSHAQRYMDKLDRGLVAVNTGSGIFLSWRIQGEEYYDVAYNVYRDGKKLNASPLTVSNYTDKDGSSSSKYTVRAVVRGKESSEASKAVTPWAKDYLEIPIHKIYSNADGRDITSYYEPNDATIADLDGDGEMEILLKLRNTNDAANSYPNDATDFDIIQVYKLDGTLLWWIDCGRNMTDFQSNEINIAAYDWDRDGKAECIMRAADGTVLHFADGTKQVIGDSTVNTRPQLSRGGAQVFTHTGAEYLLYLNGQTGKPYYVGDYPLKRLEAGETDLAKAWGDAYGHRSTKHFFGAPYLDGKKPSIFLARGIYTRHKMIALDVDPATHKLTERWRWTCNTPGSPWYGQGYHNYSIADVDWDGRDEIVFGSMVIDDNGHGLSTTGLGHGDSQHVGDFNPYKHGQEVVACNEDAPNNNYRDATTSQIYYRTTSSNDDGRAIAGNFSNDYTGAQFITAHDAGTLISTVTNAHIPGSTSNNVAENFRIFWDGDLEDETFNGQSARNSAGVIYKYGRGPIRTFSGTLTNNDTKSTPCMQADIFGDWREELILRSSDNKSIRVYTTTIPTEHRNYTLLHDPQYRNAMVWQMNGYNQTPHPSYFLGEREGITAAPPAPTTTGRTEIASGSTIGSSLNDKQVLLDAQSDATVSVAAGASPYIFFDNAPTWVQGHDDNNNITTTTYTHTLTGGGFGGSMRLVKQGDGTLVLPSVEQTYSGNTDVWAGKITFNGTMRNSRVWLNRFASLTSDGGHFDKGITADYDATINIGSDSKASTITTDSLNLHFGSRVAFKLYADGTRDKLTANTLTLEKKDWTDGPEYLAPRFSFSFPEGKVKAGTYTIANVGKVVGDLGSVVIEGLEGHKASLVNDNGTIKLVIADLREAATVEWTGASDNSWNLAGKENFRNESTSSADVFVSGDSVVFNDNASNTNVNITEDVSPASVTFSNNSKTYTISGNAITGTTGITKTGSGRVNITNNNTFTGNVSINGGTVVPTSLGIKDGVNTGAFGNYTNTVTLNGGTLATETSLTTSHPVAVGSAGGSIDVADGTQLTLNGSVSGRGNTLVKSGNGTLTLPSSVSLGTLIVNGGRVNGSENGSTHAYPSTIILNGGSLYDDDNIYSYSTNRADIQVPEGAAASWYLDERCAYKGTLSGSGTLNVITRGPRMTVDGSWSSFTGQVNISGQKAGSYDPQFVFNNSGLPRASVNITVSTSNNGKNVSLGNLSGSAALSGKGTWTIGALNNDVRFNGTFSGGSIVKTGSGVWSMSKTMASLGGNATVNGGVMNIVDNSKSSLFFGNHDVVVSGTGTLSGIAYVNNIFVNSGATVYPGPYTSAIKYGSLKTKGSIFCYSGSTARFFIRNSSGSATSRSYLEAGSTISMNGDIVVEAYDRYTPKAGDTFTLWTASSFTGSPSSIILPELPAGLEWDTSDLLKPEGVIRVAVSTGISSIADDAQFTADVYNAAGIKVARITTTKATAGRDIYAVTHRAGVYILRAGGDAVKVVVK